jgi:hypothetical protein
LSIIASLERKKAGEHAPAVKIKGQKGRRT